MEKTYWVTNLFDANLPMGIVLIKHEMDYASKFLAQQYSQVDLSFLKQNF